MNERELLDHLAHVWARDVAPTVRANSCILGARVASGVLDYYGIRNEVLACHAMVLNTAAARMIEAHTPVSEWPPEAWSIGTNDDPALGNGYGGHVIVRVHDGTLIDLTAAQFHRQGRIHVDGPRVWDRTEVSVDRGTFIIREGNVWFSFMPTGDRSYRHARDWRMSRPLVGRVIRIIRNTTTEGSR